MAILPPMKKSLRPVKEDRPSRLPKPIQVESDIEVVEEEEEEKTEVNKPDIHSVQKEISRMLKFSTFEPEQRYWLDTGSEQLNATLGSRDKGLPFGKIYELSGMEHGGKTAIATILAGMSQQDGAAVGYIDLEDSRDPLWAGKLGLDFDGVLPVFPKLIRENKKKGKLEFADPAVGKLLKAFKIPDLKLQSAELLFAEAEAGMSLFSQRGFKKQFWMLDSVANIQTEMSITAGTTDRNMRVNVDRAMFLSNALPRWAALAANYNAMIVLVNQLRDKVGVVFGDPSYSPGGRALRHACAIRARVRRIKNGQLRQNGKVVGIQGVIKNEKNKAGGGSVEREEVAFRIKWSKTPAKIEFMPVSEVED